MYLSIDLKGENNIFPDLNTANSTEVSGSWIGSGSCLYFFHLMPDGRDTLFVTHHDIGRRSCQRKSGESLLRLYVALHVACGTVALVRVQTMSNCR